MISLLAQDEADAEEQGPSVEEQTLATLQEIRDELKRPMTPPSNLLNVRSTDYLVAEITIAGTIWSGQSIVSRRVCSIRGVTWGV